MKPSDKLDSLWLLGALLLVHTIGPQAVIVAPALTQAYVTSLGVQDSIAGVLVSTEFFGVSAAAVSMTFLIQLLSWRLLLYAGLLLMVVGNLASAFYLDADILRFARFACGLGGGTLVAVTYVMIGQSSRQQRNFALAIALVLAYGVVAFPVIEFLVGWGGLRALVFFFAVFSSLGFLVVHLLPDHEIEVDHAVDVVEDVDREKGASEPSNYWWRHLIASQMLLLYFVGIMGAWTYFFRFGIRSGLDESTIALALSTSQFAGFAGAMTIALFDRRVNLVKGVCLGVVIGALATGSMSLPHSVLTFFLANFVFQFAWNATHPMMLAVFAKAESRGRLVACGTAMQFLGISLGPFLAAQLVTDNALASSAVFGAVASLLSLIFLTFTYRSYPLLRPVSVKT